MCRAAADTCDAAETCTGVSPVCPAVDAPKPAGTVCRLAVGVCESAETCDGSAFSCPADTGPPGPDTDGDGVCDAGDPCTNVGGAQDFLATPRSVIASAPRKISVSGALTLPGSLPFSAFDPTVTAVEVTFVDAGGATLASMPLPTSSFPLFGWKRNVAGTKWTFKDAAAQFGAIKVKKVLVANTPSGVRVKLKGKAGLTVASASALPVDVAFTLGDPTAGGMRQEYVRRCRLPVHHEHDVEVPEVS